MAPLAVLPDGSWLPPGACTRHHQDRLSCFPQSSKKPNQKSWRHCAENVGEDPSRTATRKWTRSIHISTTCSGSSTRFSRCASSSFSWIFPLFVHGESVKDKHLIVVAVDGLEWTALRRVARCLAREREGTRLVWQSSTILPRVSKQRLPPAALFLPVLWNGTS